ncbi:hypothetical protein M5E88_19690 [Akkermansia muciniphila]|nr:hypothetical protein M5E88_19690 [Akkermansia muciniphila]
MITAHRGLSASKIAASLRMGMEMGTAPFVKKLTDFGIRKPVREAGSTEVNPVYRPKIFRGHGACLPEGNDAGLHCHPERGFPPSGYLLSGQDRR